MRVGIRGQVPEWPIDSRIHRHTVGWEDSHPAPPRRPCRHWRIWGLPPRDPNQDIASDIARMLCMLARSPTPKE